DSGIAFQLRDDVLGAGFDAESMGKSANDIVEGKRTLLVVRAWQRADPEGRQRIERALGNPRATPDEVAAAQSVIRSTGSLDYSERRIVALSERALRRVRASHRLSTPGKALLVQIAQRLTQRRI
ncbi:MAG TPA: polyprenyl synthetase family protein, partial [Thermoplasmata archaeon]|nr:polyprenyl synthetase family protein [Thermoplasmata archaeon]